MLATNSIDMPRCEENLRDDADFEVLFKQYFTPLCAWCQYKFNLEPDTAKEAAHSAYIKLWENRGNLMPGLSAKAYLYKIATNISLDMLRHEKVKQKHVKFILQNTSEVTSGEGFDHPDMKQLASDINNAVFSLPEQMRRIFELSRYEGLKYAEIAERLNISVKTVETQMSRALVKLRYKLSCYLTAFFICILLNF